LRRSISVMPSAVSRSRSSPAGGEHPAAHRPNRALGRQLPTGHRCSAHRPRRQDSSGQDSLASRAGGGGTEAYGRSCRTSPSNAGAELLAFAGGDSSRRPPAVETNGIDGGSVTISPSRWAAMPPARGRGGRPASRPDTATSVTPRCWRIRGPMGRDLPGCRDSRGRCHGACSRSIALTIRRHIASAAELRICRRSSARSEA
jgi:hypothetical protein